MAEYPRDVFRGRAVPDEGTSFTCRQHLFLGHLIFWKVCQMPTLSPLGWSNSNPTHTVRYFKLFKPFPQFRLRWHDFLYHKHNLKVLDNRNRIYSNCVFPFERTEAMGILTNSFRKTVWFLLDCGSNSHRVSGKKPGEDRVESWRRRRRRRNKTWHNLAFMHLYS